MNRRSARAARGASAVALVALVGAVTAAGSQGAAPGPHDLPASVVRVPASARTLVCPGPLALPDDAVAGDAAFDPTPAPTLTVQGLVAVAAQPGGPVGPASLTPVAGGAPLVGLPAGAGAVVGRLADVPSATVLGVEPSAGEAPTAGGATASVTAQGDLRGLAAASCAAPSADLWLVGGSTEIGSSALLVVANPGRTAAEVSVAVLGPSGSVETPGGAFLVAPGAERALLLEGVAAEQRRLTVRVTAAGGLVTAHLQDTRLNGFTPAGTDLVTAGAGPATRQVVAGIVVPATDIGAADTAQVRLVAPERDAVVRLALLGAAGPVELPGAERIEIDAGEVTDVSLAGLPAGAYTAVVDADVPVAASAVLTRPGPPVELGDVPTLERAWAAAGPAGGGGVVAVPEGVAATVVVGSVAAPGRGPEVGSATGTVRVLGVDGAVLGEQALGVAAGSTTALDAAALSGGQPVAAVQLVPDSGAVSGTDSGGDGPALAWAVLATVGTGPDELLSVLTPVPDPPARPSVAVRAGATLGLP